MTKKKTHRRFTARQKVEILSLRLLEGKPVGEVCERYRIHRTTFSDWQRALVRRGAEAFKRSGPRLAQRVIQRLQKAAKMRKGHRRFTAQEKVEILSLHLLEGKPIREVCERYKIDRALLGYWRRGLVRRGAEAFKGPGPCVTDRIIRRLQKVAVVRKMQRRFTAQEKVEILSLRLLEGKPVGEVCERYRIHRTTFSDWQRALARRGVEAFKWSGRRPADRVIRKLQKAAAMRKGPRRFTAREKVEILSLRLLEGKLAWEVCERYKIDKTTFYDWQRALAHRGVEAFKGPGRPPAKRVIRRLLKRVPHLKAKLVHK